MPDTDIIMDNMISFMEYERNKLYRTNYYEKNKTKIQTYQREYYRKYIKKNRKKARGFTWRGEKITCMKITKLDKPIVLNFD